MIGRAIRHLLFVLGLIGAAPLILVTFIEAALTGGRSIRVYGQCKELLAAVPTFIGEYLRSAFYWAVCPGISTGIMFSYGSMVARKDATIKRGVVIGVHSIIGHADIGRDVLIAARVSILSGKYLHGRPGERSNGDSDTVDHNLRVAIGDNSWIGEGSLILANVGSNCTVGAGSVVYKDVPDHSTVMGNPARKVSIDPAGKGE